MTATGFHLLRPCATVAGVIVDVLVLPAVLTLLVPAAVVLGCAARVRAVAPVPLPTVLTGTARWSPVTVHPETGRHGRGNLNLYRFIAAMYDLMDGWNVRYQTHGT